MSANPLVTVIIATYNWSSVLRYSIQSVLWQTFQDWELLVVGDACTDDSEQVVASFNDPRIQWHNLPQNSGSQFGPNNKGIELARGQYIAYLGHDDLWYFDHLETLVATMQETGCDLASTVTEVIRPTVEPTTYLLGLSPSGGYEFGMFAPPSSWMHTTALMRDIGGWRDYRALRVAVDVDVLTRSYEAGKKLRIVNALTVVKFPSSLRKDSYVTKRSDEQADYAGRIRSDPQFRYRELMRIVSQPWYVKRLFESSYLLFGTVEYGDITRGYRAMRGLPDMAAIAPEIEEPIFRDRRLLKLLNAKADIGPIVNRIQLLESNEIPEDGLFVGFGWHAAEENVWGQCFRWAPDEVEIVVTRPTGMHRRLMLNIEPGPGVGSRPFTLYVLDDDDAVVAAATVTGGITEVELPIHAGEGRVFKLHTKDGGQRIETDPRILNFLVYRFGWVDAATLQTRQDMAATQAALAQSQAALERAQADLAARESELAQSLADARAALARTDGDLETVRSALHEAHGALQQLERFRRTSLRYWMARIRTSPKLRRWLRLPPHKQP